MIPNGHHSHEGQSSEKECHLTRRPRRWAQPNARMRVDGPVHRHCDQYRNFQSAKVIGSGNWRRARPGLCLSSFSVFPRRSISPTQTTKLLYSLFAPATKSFCAGPQRLKFATPTPFTPQALVPWSRQVFVSLHGKTAWTLVCTGSGCLCSQFGFLRAFLLTVCICLLSDDFYKLIYTHLSF